MTGANSTDNSKLSQAKKDGRKGGNRKRATAEQFLAKARKVHGNKFDYSKTVYSGSTKKVVITCRAHGDFQQGASRHLRNKHACPECAAELIPKAMLRTTKMFISAANKKHDYKYDYSESEYIGGTEDLIIICPEHGSFKRTATNHLAGYGCNICAGVRDRVRDTNSFIIRANEVHGEGRYDYSRSIYISSREKIKIMCSEHGFFEQPASNHLQGNGCSACATELAGGYSRSDYVRICDKNNNGNASLYVIRCYNGSESFYKIGRTSTSLQTRFHNRQKMPYSFESLYIVSGRAGYIYDLEVRLHSLLKSCKHKPSIDFRGHTECFGAIKPIDRLLKKLSLDSQLQLIA